MGNNEVAAPPDHHVVRTDDGHMTGGARSTMGSRSLMGTMEASTMVQRR